MGLVADSLHMLADSFVYGISLFAAGGTLIRKMRIAKVKKQRRSSYESKYDFHF